MAPAPLLAPSQLRGTSITPARHPLGFLQLLSPLDGICLVLAPPLGHLGIGLGQQPLQLSLGLGLFLVLFPQEVTVVPQSLHSMGQRTLGLQRPQ